MEHAFLPFEAKFKGQAEGTFEGYGAIFGNEDSHGDLILPGAFTESLALRTAQGRSLPMYAMHGFRLGADPLPVGRWTKIAEDAQGLKVTGEILALDTEYGRRIHALVKGGALGGLSIGYSVPRGGAAHGAKPGEPKRTLKRINLLEISLVDDPANAEARVTAIKASQRGSHALDEFARALRDGEPPSIKEFEDILREAGVPKSMAVAIASHGYAKAIRSESGGMANDEAVRALRDAVKAFNPGI